MAIIRNPNVLVHIVCLGGTAPNVNEQLCEKRFLKIGKIHPTVFTRACNLLNIHQVQGNDWRGLAGELDFDVTDVMVRTGAKF